MKSHTITAFGAFTGMPSPPAPRSQASTSGPFFASKLGADVTPPAPSGPWQTTQFFWVKSTLPSAAVPWPGGSPAPVGLIVISWASSAALGACPTPYVCANAALARGRKIGTILSESIGHTSVAGDFPGHNGVVILKRPELRRISHALSLGSFL